MAEGSIILSGHTDVWSPDLVGSQDAHTEMMICSPAAQASWLPRSPVFGPRACSHHYPAKSCWHSLCWGWEALKEHGLNQWAPEICSSSHLAVYFFIFILSTSQLHSKMFFLKTCLLLRYKSTYFSHVVHASVMQYKKITSWWLDVNNSNTKH